MAIYYLSKSGNDSWDGLAPAWVSGTNGPWLTIAKANATLAAGDTVQIRTGTWEENNGGSTIVPGVTGTAGNWISYENYLTETPIIQGTTAGAAPYTLVNIQPTRHYISIHGIEFTGASQAQSSLDPIVYIAGTHIEFTYNVVRFVKAIPDSGAAGVHLAKQGGNRPSYCVVDHNTISYCGNPPDYPNVSGEGEGVRVEGDYQTVTNNLISKCGHNAIGDYGSNHVICKGNIMLGDWFRAIGAGAKWAGESESNWLIEDNVSYNITGRDPWDEYVYGSQFSGTGIIYRKNVLYNCQGIGLAVYAETGQETDHLMFYNNTIFNVGTAQYYDSGWGLLMHEVNNGTLVNCSIVNNIFHDQYVDGIWWRDYAVIGDHDVTNNAWNGTDPLFVNEGTYDLHLQVGSPCINAGRFLTTITSSTGGGTSVVVANARFFCDGYGLIDGDVIQIEGQTQTVRITNINYSTNTITVDQSLSWVQGDGIALHYHGTAPDQGAFEYTGESMLQTELVGHSELVGGGSTALHSHIPPPFMVPFMNTITLTNSPAAVREWANQTSWRIRADLTGMTQFRVVLNVQTAGATNADVHFEGSANEGSNWYDLNNAGGPELAINPAGAKDTGWQTLYSTLGVANVLIRGMEKDGDGVIDPIIRQVILMFK